MTRIRDNAAVLGIGAGLTLLLLVVAMRYGWHRDEFYYVASAKHLAWGYVDNPPLTPAIAWLAATIAPHNLFVLRMVPAIVAGATAVMGSVVVAEFGGSKAARIAGAAVVAAGGFVIGVGHLLATPGVDSLAWLALVAVTARMLRTNEPRLWVAFGAVAGVALFNKNLVALLALSVLVSLVVERRWVLLRSHWLVVGGLIALTLAAPTIVWQAQHDWPQFAFARALADRIGAENRITLLPLQLLFVGPAFVVVGWRGVGWLRRSRVYRPLLWMWLVVVALVFVTGGRPYYAVPLTITIVLAGVGPTLDRVDLARFFRLVIPNAVVSVLFALPVLPAARAGAAASLNETVAETIGWPELARQVHDAVAHLPAAEQRHAVVITGSYGEAGALDFYRKRFDLPPVYSPHNSYADFGQPSDDGATVVAVRFSSAALKELFRSCRVVARVDNHLDVHNEVYGTAIDVCRGLRRPWPVTWARMRFFA